MTNVNTSGFRFPQVFLDYFKYPTVLARNFKVHCKVCERDISATMSAKTSNPKTHLRHMHPVQFEELNRQLLAQASQEAAKKAASLDTKDGFIDGMSQVGADTSKSPGASKSPSPQPILTSHYSLSYDNGMSDKYRPDHPRQRQHTENLMRVVAENLLPTSFIASQSLHDLLSNMDAKFRIPPCEYFSNTLIPNQHAAINNKIAEELSHANSVCVTLSALTQRPANITHFVITCHFMTNWRQRRALIACKRFYDKFTADDIHTAYEDAVGRFNLHTKVDTVVTNGSGGTSLSIFRTNDCETETVEAETDEAEQIELQSFVNDRIPYTILCLKCTQQALQMAVHDGLKMYKHYATLLKVKDLIVKCQKSGQCSAMLAMSAGCDASDMNATGWKNELICVRSLVDLPLDFINSIDPDIKLTESEVKVLIKLVAVLMPFKDTADMLETDFITAGLVIPVVKLLRTKIQNLTAELGDDPLLINLSESVDRRLQTFDSSNDTYVICSFIDPRFKLNWCSDEEKEKCHSVVTEACLQVCQYTEEHDVPPVKRQRGVFDCILQPTERRSRQDQLRVELDIYLSSPLLGEEGDPSLYWSEETAFPTVRTLASRYLAIPAAAAKWLLGHSNTEPKIEGMQLTDTEFSQLVNIRANRADYSCGST